MRNTKLTLTELKDLFEYVFDIDIKTRVKKEPYNKYRRMFCYIAKVHTNASYSKIGRFINRTHATVMHHYNEFQNIKDMRHLEAYKSYYKEYLVFMQSVNKYRSLTIENSVKEYYEKAN